MQRAQRASQLLFRTAAIQNIETWSIDKGSMEGMEYASATRRTYLGKLQNWLRMEIRVVLARGNQHVVNAFCMAVVLKLNISIPLRINQSSFLN